MPDEPHNPDLLGLPARQPAGQRRKAGGRTLLSCWLINDLTGVSKAHLKKKFCLPLVRVPTLSSSPKAPEEEDEEEAWGIVQVASFVGTK